MLLLASFSDPVSSHNLY